MKQESKQANALSSDLSSATIACWVGLDWADQKHCVVVRSTPGGAAGRHTLEQKPAALEEFFLELRAKYPHGPIAVGIEQSRGPVLYGLLKFDFLVIYPVNPRSLADYRRAFNLSGAKDDPRDADLLCELVSHHADRLRPLVVEDVSTRTLRLLVEARRDFVQERTALTNHLGATLKCYYPVALEVVGESLDSALALEFLRRWPTLAKLQAAQLVTLRRFFYAHNSRSEEKILRRLEAIAQARPLTEDPALIEPLSFQTERLVQHLRKVNQTIEDYDRQIREVFAQHSEARLFSELPGAGPVLAPRLAALFGTIRSNFPSAREVLCWTGVAPVKKQSGTQEVVHFRYARPIFVHQSIVEFAKCSIGQCQWARLLYEHHLKKGKTKWAAIRVVAYRWVRILWRCWIDQVPYDELKYLRRLQEHGVQLYSSLYTTLPPLETSL